MKTNAVYVVEKRFKDLFGLIPRDDLYIRETPSGTYTITVPHPSDDVEYVLSVYRKGDAPKEFVDLGTCVKAALALGAKSVHFRLAQTPPMTDQ